MILPKPIRWNPKTRLPYRDIREFQTSLWTPQQTYIWEKARFTVPNEVSEERVQFAGDKYRRKFGKVLELEGFTVLSMDGPKLDTSVVAMGITAPDRRGYVIWAKVTRRPVTLRVDVPDDDVPYYQQAGYKLVS